MTPPNNPKARVVEIMKETSFKLMASSGLQETVVMDDDFALVADRLDSAGLLVKPWMSVKERRPDGAYDVLVYYGNARRKIVSTACYDTEWWPRHENTAPTHWQTIPDPPKEPS